MPRIILIIILCLLVAAVIALLFTIFFSPVQKIRYSDCILLQNPQTNQIDCFGCADNNCKDAPATWIKYTKPEIGIPYACYKTEQGCQLAQ
ncbi:MAG: hypothetical protein NT116_04035 [Candidatus Parcubacteria bacterium]|nr:hypothetical protein [Candidatus Parcubacteria bacterium]